MWKRKFASVLAILLLSAILAFIVMVGLLKANSHARINKIISPFVLALIALLPCVIFIICGALDIIEFKHKKDQEVNENYINFYSKYSGEGSKIVDQFDGSKWKSWRALALIVNFTGSSICIIAQFVEIFQAVAPKHLNVPKWLNTGNNILYFIGVMLFGFVGAFEAISIKKDRDSGILDEKNEDQHKKITSLYKTQIVIASTMSVLMFVSAACKFINSFYPKLKIEMGQGRSLDVISAVRAAVFLIFAGLLVASVLMSNKLGELRNNGRATPKPELRNSSTFSVEHSQLAKGKY